MSASRRIEPVRVGDVEEVGRYLAAGFGVEGPAAAGFAPEVMAWKFFDPAGEDDDGSPRGFVARDGVSGRLVGFVGACPGAWHLAGEAAPIAPTIHMIDWLADKGKGHGAHLFLRVHRGMATGYVLGGSPDARRVIAGAGYERWDDAPAFARTLRPWRGIARARGTRGLLRAGRELLRGVVGPGARPTRPVTLRPVETFGAEVGAVLAASEAGVVHTGRGPGRLNHLLRQPGPAELTGWTIDRGGRAIGFGLLALIDRGRVREGKVVDLVLAGRDPDDWHAGVAALTAELKTRGAEVAVALGTTPWMASALGRSGYVERYRLECAVRDPGRIIPRDRPVHLSFLEADYAYT